MSEVGDGSNVLMGIIQLVGGPAAAVGAVVILINRILNTKFDEIHKDMAAVTESNKLQESTLTEIKTKIAIAESQSHSMSRAIDDFRAMEKTITLLQSKVEASFRVIDDMKARSDRVESRADRIESEQAGIRETLRVRQ